MQLSSFFNKNNTVYEEEEPEDSEHSEGEQRGRRMKKPIGSRRRMTHHLVERYNSGLKLKNNFPNSIDNFENEPLKQKLNQIETTKIQDN